jgi:hypothetical protein
MTWRVLREIVTGLVLWAREIAGWGLVLIGLAIFVVVYECFGASRPVDAFGFLIMGIFVFRGRIHLLKVAVAARVCRHAQDQLYPAPAPPSPQRRRVSSSGG